MDSVVSNLCALASSRLSRSSDLTQGRKGERDAKMGEMRPRFFAYARELPLATTENVRTRDFHEKDYYLLVSIS